MLQEYCDNGGVAATKQAAVNLQEARGHQVNRQQNQRQQQEVKMATAT
jgi:hypothetical protein